MPDILIRGMEMPRGCGDCYLQSGARYCYGIHGFIPKSYCNSNYQKHEKCPLHELPPHGDLIDRCKIQYTELYGGAEVTTANWIDRLPIIVPASEEVADGHEP